MNTPTLEQFHTVGYFSFNTSDTGRSIANSASTLDTFKVIMKDNDGNSWTELDYDGYGEFGGKDFYELLAEMNGQSTRDEGIELIFAEGNHSGCLLNALSRGVVAPILVEDDSLDFDDVEPPENCEYQGFFYEDEDDYDDWGTSLEDFIPLPE